MARFPIDIVAVGDVPLAAVPIVRTEAARLRARLSEYYSNGGRADPTVIEIPKGVRWPIPMPMLFGGNWNAYSPVMASVATSA